MLYTLVKRLSLMNRKKSQPPRKKKVPYSLWLLGAVIIFFVGYFSSIFLSLPDVRQIANLEPAESTKIYSADGKIISTLHEEENRIMVPLNEISFNLKNAVIASEDARFYSHPGIDLRSIARAVFTNVVRGRVLEGGSTITQQLARSLFLTRERTITRKIAEIILALLIERHYSKEEILELYLNQIYWGHNAYGIGAAANVYFGKTPAELNLAESALLGGLLKGPELYSPHKNLAAALIRQREVLKKMVLQHLIQPEEANRAAKEPIKLNPLPKTRYEAPFFVDYVLSQLNTILPQAELFKGGYRIYTTLDSTAQKAAEAAIEKMKEQGPKAGFSEMALLAIDPRNSFIKAMVGGVNYSKSQYNRTWQSLRQPGSAFKIFTYIAAFENDFSPGDVIDDSPVSYDTPQGPWDVQNYDLIFKGPTTLRDGLRFSRNVVTVKLLDLVGVDKVVNVIRRLGITANLEANLSLALGTSEVSMMELLAAFAVLPAGGVYFKPVAVLKVEDRAGQKVYENQFSEPRLVLDKNVANLMVDLMQQVVLSGTGTRAYFGRPAAGKTGTTSDWKDAWFVGFTPELAAAVWLGNDDNKPTNNINGGSIPADTWKLFMSEALKDKPVQNFSETPAGMVKLKICKVSGKIATDRCPAESISEEWFWQEKAPADNCNVH
jgi:penicillin-binding protein 1A